MMERKSISKIAVAGLVTVLAVEAAFVVRTMAADDAKGSGKIVIDGSTTVGPIAKAFAEYYMSVNPGVTISVSESGSGNGAKALIAGSCDIASMSRFMKDAEFKAATDKGVFPVAHVVAMDGIAIAVHPSNPIAGRGLTVKQVRDIYTGKINNWSELGGPDLKIVRISRDTSSGTYETFEGLVMKNEKLAADTEYVGAQAAMRERIKSTASAIGYVGLGFLDDSIRALEIDGVYPDNNTVASGRYPVARPLFLFTNGYPALGGHVHAFVTLHLSRKGQEMVEQIGYVPVTKY
ncbi:MAG TPA: phosphate ABC transporter substrate-binding protein [Phycisphaerae bacterium]|nr:phosphate ABC transporter substrate-binding protein [Phycisphaerae bacterium]